MRASRG